MDGLFENKYTRDESVFKELLWHHFFQRKTMIVLYCIAILCFVANSHRVA